VDVLETHPVIIKHVFDFNKVIHREDGPYAWPGGYPCHFICSDGEALSWKAAEENAGLIRDALIADDRHSGWHVCAFDINWEDEDLLCAHTNEPIECAYPTRTYRATPIGPNHELCDECGDVLEESQIGLCEDCQEMKHVD
jgi:hypothetical protein